MVLDFSAFVRRTQTDGATTNTQRNEQDWPGRRTAKTTTTTARIPNSVAYITIMCKT